MQYQISFEFVLLPACAVLTLAWDQYILNCIKSLVQHHVNIIMRSSCFKTYDIHYFHYGCIGCRIVHLFFFRKVFSRTNVVSPAGGASRILLSSSKGEQHILPSQAFVQARLQARRRGREGSSLWTTGEASLGEDPEQEANSG